MHLGISYFDYTKSIDGQHQSYESGSRALVSGVTPQMVLPEYELVEKVREAFRKRCGPVLTMGALLRNFGIMDGHRDRQSLSWPEFSMSMQDVGSLNAQEIGMAFRLFDPDASNSIGQTEFLKGIRGGLNAERKVLVHQIFKGLNTGGDGKIRQKDMEVKYKGADIAPMMRAFGNRGKDGVITLEDFEDCMYRQTRPFDTLVHSLPAT